MTDESKCLKCGAPLTRDAREGVCPECLFEQAQIGQGKDESTDSPLPVTATKGEIEEEVRHLVALFSS